MRWVADTGPLLHLAEAGVLHLLPRLGEIALPPAVQAELAKLSPAIHLPGSMQVVLLSASSETVAEDWCRAGLVHRGEAQAIALARQTKAHFLTDDTAARLLAGALGLQTRGSLGVILWLAGQQYISIAEAGQYLDRLAASSLWVSPRIMAEAHAALRRLTGPQT